MPLKLVIGRANAGKTGWILTWALEALEQGTPPTLVVPNLADVRRLQRELSGKAPLGVRVLTPDALAEELWQLHGDGRRLIGERHALGCDEEDSGRDPRADGPVAVCGCPRLRAADDQDGAPELTGGCARGRFGAGGHPRGRSPQAI